MTVKAAFCADPVRVEVTYSGTVVPDDLTSAVAEAFALAQEHHTFHVLTDCSAMTGNPSIFNLFDIASTLEKLGLESVYREAVVTSQDRSHDADFEFYENAMVNRRLTVRRFGHREDALRWLAEADVVVPPEAV